MRSYLEEKGKVKIKKSYKIHTQTWKCFRVSKGNAFFLEEGKRPVVVAGVWHSDTWLHL